MKQPNYLVFGLLWTLAAAVSVINFVQYLDDRGNLIRGGLFLLMGIFYFWMHNKNKKK